MRAVALLSGGLDSTLAVRVLQDQDIELKAINFKSVFCTCTPKGSSCSAARTAVKQLGVDLKTVSTSSRFLDVIKNPKHGYGSEMNPCLDCRIMMMKRAHEYMKDIDAQFMVTGEVLGERPMSQRREAMKLIEREAGVEGLVLRPLCAQHMEPTIPEEKGWVDRDQLLDMRGRNRTPQIELAEDLGISDYPCPAGGCRLTDPGFASRMRDLLDHKPDFDLNDVRLLIQGRHFRLSPDCKAIMGREEQENLHLRGLAREGDLLMELSDVPGPLTVLRGDHTDEHLRTMAALTARYSKARDQESVRATVWNIGCEKRTELSVEPAGDNEYSHMLVTPD